MRPADVASPSPPPPPPPASPAEPAVRLALGVDDPASAPGRLRALLDGIEGIVWESAHDGTITFVSQKAERILGHKVADWLSTPGFWADRIHPLDREATVAFRKDHARASRDHEMEYRMLRADGTSVWIRDVVTVERDGDGRARALRGLMLDVTAAKSTERRLSAQLEISALLVDASTLDDVATRILEAVGVNLGWELGAMWRPRPEGGIGCFAQWRAGSGPGVEFERATSATVLARGRGLPGRVWESGRPAWVPDVVLDDNFPRASAAAKEGLHAAIAFPIRGRERVHAVVEFFHREPRTPDPRLILLLENLGTQIGLFLDRKAAEEAVRESNARRGAILSASLDCVITIDVEGRILEFNPAAERTFGWLREDVLGREMAEVIVPPELREAHRQGLRRFVQTGVARALGQRLELPAIRRDGSTFPAELAIVRVPTEGSAIFTGFLRDITERTRAEAALRQGEERYRSLVQAMANIVWVTTPEGEVDDMPSWRAFTGQAPADVRGRGWTAAIHEEDRGRFLRVWGEAIAGRAAFQTECRLRRADGAHRVFSARGAPVLNADGTVREWVGVMIDVTERIVAEETLALQKALLESQIEAVPDGMLVVGPSGETLSYNKRFLQSWGVDAATAALGEAALLDAMKRRASDPTPLSGGLSKRGDHDVVRDLVHMADGRVLDRYGGPVLGADGTLHGRVWVFRDVTDRKRTEETLSRLLVEVETQRKRLDNIVASVPGVVWESWSRPDPAAGRADFVSDHIERITGYTPGEWLATPEAWASLLHPDERERATAELQAIVASAQGGTIEHRWRRKDGGWLWAESWVVGVRDGAGRPIGARGVTLDVSGRKRAEVALKASEARYRFLADSVPGQVWTAGPDGQLDYVNLRVLDYSGVTFERLLAEGWDPLVHPEDLVRVAPRWQRSLETGEVYEVEFRLLRHDGTWRWHLGRAVPLHDEAGRVVKWFGANTDIDDSKRLTSELEYQVTLTKTITDNAGSALFMIDAAGHPMFMNPAAMAMTGYASIDELKGRPLHESIHAVRADGAPYPMEECPIERANEEVRRLKDQRETFTRKSGSLFPVAFNLAPVEREGRRLGSVLEVRDITEQLEAEDQLRRRADELARLAEALERSNRDLDQFAYVASHDLKAPLRGIANLSRWIEEDMGERIDAAGKQHMDLLRGRVHRMEGLIDAILQYSRVGRAQGKVERVDVGEVVRDCVDLLAPPHGFTVEAAGPLPVLETERAPLQQVFLNLLGNAIKHHHSPATGRVHVGAEDAGAFWRFSVADDGPGIAPRFHQKVFVIFQTLEARDKVEGTGIGLALVKKIVESQGGAIELESDQGKGATFRFTWPKAPSLRGEPT